MRKKENQVDWDWEKKIKKGKWKRRENTTKGERMKEDNNEVERMGKE